MGGVPTKKPRVVFVDHVARLSGAELALLGLLPHLHEIEPHVILGEIGPLADHLKRAGTTVEILPISPFARDFHVTRQPSAEEVRIRGPLFRATLSTVLYVGRLAIRLRQLNPDLVHLNSLKAGVYGCLAARLAGIPVVWHLRDRIAPDYLPMLATRLLRSVIRALTPDIVANSHTTLQTVPVARRGARHIIPNCVVIPAVRRTTRAITVFGMVGRIDPWKGQDFFLRAFAQAFPHGPERAVLVGAPLFGEHAYATELRRIVANFGLESRVDFRGFRDDIWSELAAIDVLVHASLLPEPFGQVVLEGMAAGLPIISVDDGGPAELLTDRQSGRLFPRGDARALAQLMRTLRDDPTQCEILGRNAREAAKRYDPASIARKLEDVYREVLL